MRYDSVTITKAIAILLMVLAHAYIPLWWQQYINMFHMPLFFFFSGYCFKDKYLLNATTFIKKKFQGIYIPFVKWSLLFLLLHNLFYYLNIYNGEYGFKDKVSFLYSWKDYLFHAINIVTRMSGNEQLLGGYWFLNTLLWCSIAGFFLIMKCNRMLLTSIIVLLTCLISSQFNLYIPYWGIDKRELLATFFFLVGYNYHKYQLKIEESKWIIPLGLMFVGIGTELWQCSMISLSSEKITPYAVTSILGTLTVFSISNIISSYDNLSKKMLIYIGDNTLVILTWHFLCFKIVSLFIILTYNLPIQRLAEFPVIEEYASKGWWISYFIVGFTIPLFINHILKYCFRSKT